MKCTIVCVTHYNDAESGSEALIVAHVPLVGHIVRETMARVPSHVDRDDLTSAGLTALVQAAQAYDAERGVPFNRYAATRIRGAIVDELRSIDWASRSVRRKARELDTTRARLATVLGRSASTSEVAQATGLSAEEIAANEEDVARAQVLSLHASEDDALGESLVSSSPTPEMILEHRERLTYMTEAIAELPERLRLVVEQYFLAERPMAEIAADPRRHRVPGLPAARRGSGPAPRRTEPLARAGPADRARTADRRRGAAPRDLLRCRRRPARPGSAPLRKHQHDPRERLT